MKARWIGPDRQTVYGVGVFESNPKGNPEMDTTITPEQAARLRAVNDERFVIIPDPPAAKEKKEK